MVRQIELMAEAAKHLSEELKTRYPEFQPEDLVCYCFGLTRAGFYAILNKPAWAPPAAVFGPVWTVLYLLMAVAAWLVWVGFAAVLNAVLWRLNPELL